MDVLTRFSAPAGPLGEYWLREQEKKLRCAAMREPFWMDEMLLSLSRPRGWRDEHGRLREAIPCPRCGRITPLLDPSAQVMRLHK